MHLSMPVPTIYDGTPTLLIQLSLKAAFLRSVSSLWFELWFDFVSVHRTHTAPLHKTRDTAFYCK